jgi:hypothetical protein
MTGGSDHERNELERALAALSPDSPAREALLAALSALQMDEGNPALLAQHLSRRQGATNTQNKHLIPPRSKTYLTHTAKNVVLIAGAAVLVGVFLLFSQTAVVPNVVSQERSFAIGALKSVGFETVVTARKDATVQEGQVLGQSPSAGSRVRKGSVVRIVVSDLPTFNLNGTFVLYSATTGPRDDCRGERGYDDIRSGLTVTVRDGTSRVIATGSLGNGLRSQTGGFCTFKFRISGIKQADFYSVEVGRRGQLTYSHSNMTANGWTITTELGR